MGLSPCFASRGTGSIPVTFTNIFVLFDQLLMRPLADFARFGNNKGSNWYAACLRALPLAWL